ADNWLAAERGAKFLSILAIDPRSSKPTTRLAIGEQRFGQFADFFHVERTGRAAAGIRNHTGVGIDLARLAVPQLPEVEKTLLPPKDVSAPGRVLRIGCTRQVETSGCFEVFLAMFAIAHAGAVPAVDENAVHAVA